MSFSQDQSGSTVGSGLEERQGQEAIAGVQEGGHGGSDKDGGSGVLWKGK